MIPAYLLPLANHLWQSTLVAGALALLTIAFRRNGAAVSYRFWLAASIKFLVPLSWLVGLGGWFRPWAAVAPAPTGWPAAAEQLFVPSGFASVVSTPAAASELPELLVAVWGCGVAAVLVSWWREWRRIRAALDRSSPLRVDSVQVPHNLRVVASPVALEPGVVGIVRPVLMLPVGITERLRPSELDAIIAHERCHLQRRDNLAAALHMIVEALFWFHPIVWWLEKRLVDTRERACDEEVLQTGREPAMYASAILNVCRHYMESPLVCTAGVTGSNLRRRVEQIMRNQPPRPLTTGKKLLIATIMAAAVAAPIGVGILIAPRLVAQSIPDADGRTLAFEAASVKPNKSTDRNRGAGFQPGGRFLARNMTLRSLVGIAYGTPQPLPAFRVGGGPVWIDSDGFDIEAKAIGEFQETRGGPGFSNSGELMLRTLLAERFRLKVHTETRDRPIYALVQARSDRSLGPRLSRSNVDCDAALAAVAAARAAGAPLNPADRPVCAFRGFTGSGVTLGQLSAVLTPLVQRVVLDRTGLAGRFDVNLALTADQMRRPDAPRSDASLDGPSIFTTLQEQLGLKLEPTRAPVEVVVIDAAEHPTEN
jgi:bla regulator protein blaR1